MRAKMYQTRASDLTQILVLCFFCKINSDSGEVIYVGATSRVESSPPLSSDARKYY